MGAFPDPDRAVHLGKSGLCGPISTSGSIQIEMVMLVYLQIHITFVWLHHD